jgi:hypothetical protein
MRILTGQDYVGPYASPFHPLNPQINLVPGLVFILDVTT